MCTGFYDLLLLHLNIKAVIYQYMYGVLRGYFVFSGVLKQKVTLKPQKKNGKTEKKHRMQHYEDRGQR